MTFATALCHALSLAMVLLALCGGGAQAQSGDFQAVLDRAAIPYEVPPRGKAVLVNIPAFEMILFRDGTPVSRSRVIVGAPWHRTLRLKTHVSAVRFRPTWRPTPSIIASGEYRDYVRRAGPDNPLGLAGDDRALSHGCVRVEKWAELVAFVLDMDIAEVHRLSGGTRTFDMSAPPVTVELGYYTRVPDALGTIVSYPDIYGLEQGTNRKGDAGELTAPSGPRAFPDQISATPIM